MAKILVIEDDDIIRERICKVLQAEGHDTLATGNGDKGIELALTQAPDAILCDLCLYERDGREIYTILREDLVTKNIPFIIMIAFYCDPMELLPPLYLQKPFRMEELIDIVQQALKQTDTP